MIWNQLIKDKIFSTNTALAKQVTSWQLHNEKVVFTNGCFDILHLGHIDYLTKAADLGDRLIIAVNTDASVSSLKGPSRPIIDEETRAMKLASLVFVDAVILFGEETPLKLITEVRPNVLVKGGDYTIDTIVGASEVQDNGGEVVVIPFLEGHSTTSIVNKITG
ncbi:D-glycero-beta-D-manno-heptose 1-phosphate adenylyltransferase [Bacteroidia bacterium]|jgi:rfaE bifunctional protein nucleotidyltransferase chain/domain|nr:D-glycero-beta-D-manno-heptose 1-phosphate adenylyltransferase [Bacteroidia bacterium]MDC0104878.1 D-glycero-beta-D-manno-heptose 1-phosphate adenylyltransferase [Bacteroidia bacterium]